MQRNRFFVRIVLAFLNRLSDTERAQIHTALRPQPRGYELGTAMRGTPCLVTVTASSQSAAHNRRVMQRET